MERLRYRRCLSAESGTLNTARDESRGAGMERNHPRATLNDSASRKTCTAKTRNCGLGVIDHRIGNRAIMFRVYQIRWLIVRGGTIMKAEALKADMRIPLSLALFSEGSSLSLLLAPSPGLPVEDAARSDLQRLAGIEA
jgi:hypothetical protein